MIIATAGHVDHGKTSLVYALSGVHTDAAPEALARGMTIDLGFASAQLDACTRVSFIDVPGHERFVRNMLAGVASIDLALLVVAADDGPMPQTLEHLAILGLLGVSRLVVVLSKADRVDGQRLAQASAQISALLAGGPYRSAPVFVVAAPSGQGVDALRRHLVAQATALAATVGPASAPGQFRLSIDRSFVMAGAGRVVTGAALSGVLRIGDLVQLAPYGGRLRVRGLQVLNQAADSVRAGQRCAINLAGADLKRADPARGDWLVADDAPAASDRLDVQLRWLPGQQATTGGRAQLLLHLGAATRVVRLALLASPAVAAADTKAKSNEAGQGSLARLLLDQPVSAAWGDRFILRDAAANRTLAGGRVVDAFGPQRGSTRPQRLAQLAALALDDPALALQALLRAAPDGVDLAQFGRSRGLRADELEAITQRLVLQRLPGNPTLAVTGARWLAWQAQLLQAVDTWHLDQPDSLGPDANSLQRLLGLATNAQPLLRAGLQAAVAAGTLQRAGLCHCRPGHQPLLAQADADLLARITAVLQGTGLRPPIVGELALALGLPLPTLHDGLARLVARGLLLRVAANRFYLPQQVAQLEAEARTLAAVSADGSIDAAAYRNHTGIGRNLTVQVLEFLDRAGITRFDGTRHRLRA